MIDIYTREYIDGEREAMVSFTIDGEAYDEFQKSDLFHNLQNYLKSLKQGDRKTADKILNSQEMQSIADNNTELEIAFFVNNKIIVFKKYEWEKAYFDHEFFVVETDKWKYMYNCSTIKSIEVA